MRKSRFIQNGINYAPLLPPKGCQNIYPYLTPEKTTSILKTSTYQYVAFSDGLKRMFTNGDGSNEYSTSGIFSPDNVSYMNLFINAMLQPPFLYSVREGVLTLTSSDIPPAGTPIILQFVIIHQE
ncbi:DUF4183 domain-containing protein [Bacillus sp. KH172YL63]|uniref:DUF4183 domain-containing protein n=1 Tax=Bacillus sp. KH172YL63 TaxID=2709784 RepID=UPI0013E450D3|nr:DUF4183 domain-containing protein [Bacillus sp. KH172YL63]BCB02556.1 hypothetical protein KH172YL63_06890 [Bacillus sp. KH172YL63]